MNMSALSSSIPVLSNWQIIVPDFGELAGPFQIVSLEYAGQHDGEVTFELALESAGQISFTGNA